VAPRAAATGRYSCELVARQTLELYEELGA
jgi:hypothetical protein